MVPKNIHSNEVIWVFIVLSFSTILTSYFFKLYELSKVFFLFEKVLKKKYILNNTAFSKDDDQQQTAAIKNYCRCISSFSHLYKVQSLRLCLHVPTRKSILKPVDNYTCGKTLLLVHFIFLGILTFYTMSRAYWINPSPNLTALSLPAISSTSTRTFVITNYTRPRQLLDIAISAKTKF